MQYYTSPQHSFRGLKIGSDFSPKWKKRMIFAILHVWHVFLLWSYDILLSCFQLLFSSRLFFLRNSSCRKRRYITKVWYFSELKMQHVLDLNVYKYSGKLWVNAMFLWPSKILRFTRSRLHASSLKPFQQDIFILFYLLNILFNIAVT